MTEQLKPGGYAQFGFNDLEEGMKSKEEMRQVLIIMEGERLYFSQQVPIMIMELFEGTGKIVYWAVRFVPIDPKNLLTTVEIKVNRWEEFKKEYQAFKEGPLGRVLVFWTSLENQTNGTGDDVTCGDILQSQALAWKTFGDLGEAGLNLPEYFRYDPALSRVFPRDEVLKTESTTPR